MSGDHPVTPKRKALQRLLRRRARRVRPGANSGEPVKSWGEYQSVKLNPTGSYSRTSRYLMAIAIILVGVPIALITMLFVVLLIFESIGSVMSGTFVSSPLVALVVILGVIGAVLLQVLD